MLRAGRVSRQRLEELRRIISERDRKILTAMLTCRYLTTGQIARLYFTDAKTYYAVNHSLNKLAGFGLICALKRRIGGVRAGSGSYVWNLTSAGCRLLNLDHSERLPYKNPYEPSLHFLEHSLFISEAYLQLTEICARHQITLARVRFEPECWRRYAVKGGKPMVLKPDLYAVTQASGYEDWWFLELDRDTETVALVVDKCGRYIDYLHTGAEQKQTGGFPYVVWIVPDEKRKRSVARHIRAQYPRGPDIFLAILPDELESLIVGGAAEYVRKCREDTS